MPGAQTGGERQNEASLAERLEAALRWVENALEEAEIEAEAWDHVARQYQGRLDGLANYCQSREQR
jgi:hypothetical protein